MSSPLVYIVILNWNGCQDTVECLRSCGKISYPNHQVLVVDNGSTDGSEQELRKAFPDIDLLQTGRNLGFTGGNNTGIHHALKAGAEYVLLLNNDTTVDPNFVTELVSAARTDSAIGMLCSKIYFYDDPALIWYAGASFHSWLGWGRHRGYGKRDEGQYDKMEETARPTGCALMVSREVCERVGLLRDEFFCYVEDVDWGMRARNADFKVVYVPGSKVWHKVSRSTGGSRSGMSVYYGVRNMLYCLDTNRPLPGLFRVLRYCSIIFIMVLSLATQGVPKMTGTRLLYRGVADYFRGKMGQLVP